MDDLLEYLKEEEGFVSSAYQDHLGYWTIGYGRMVDVRRGGGITKAEASDLLMNDVERIQRTLSKRIPWFYDVPWRVRNILVAMAFQMGVYGLLGFTNTLFLVHIGQYERAADEMLNSKWARQTPGRARRLSEMMRNA
jgi:lysozyme